QNKDFSQKNIAYTLRHRQYFSFYSLARRTVSSNSSSIDCSGLLIKLTITVTIVLNKKPGASSYNSKMPPLKKSPQITTVAAPTIIPAIAPPRVIRCQQRDKTISGPKAAPKPAQAYPTKSSTDESGFIAIIAAISAMATVAIRPTVTSSLSVASLLKIAL